MTELLSVKNLTVHYGHGNTHVPALRNVSLTLGPSSTLGLVGESGCGKSTLGLAVIGLLPPEESRVPQGEIIFEGENLLLRPAKDWRDIRGKKIAMIFQDPFSSLNPVLSIDYQLQEVISLEDGRLNRRRAVGLLHQVQLSDPERILDSYPHQISGGQRQRVVIAMALARDPKLLIADEPTTALDVTVQAEIIQLLKKLQQERRMAMLFISHNIGLVKEVTDDLAVMYAGEIVEFGATPDVLKDPRHPYTQGLLRSLPTLKKRTGPIPLLGGQPPDLTRLPPGCPFYPRCEKVMDVCRTDDPADRRSQESSVRCHLY